MIYIKRIDEMFGANNEYSEVRIDFFDENENVWCVDAWKTNDQNEEGTVVAKITEDGSVLWTSEDDMDNATLNEYIDDFIKNTLHTTRKGDVVAR